MKTLEELAAIREKMKSRIALRGGEGETRVVVGMATCGIAAGARPVLNAFVTEIANAGLDGITVRLSGCAGKCEYEPIVEIFAPGGEKVTYINMTPEKAVRVVSEHLKNGNIVTEYTLGNTEL
jgi:NADP-reducing hydrogenase subunit HndB